MPGKARRDRKRQRDASSVTETGEKSVVEIDPRKNTEKALGEERACGASKSSATITTDNGTSSDNSSRAETGLPSLSSCFTRVELSLNLQNERGERDAVLPRELRQLIQWCVPLSVPLVEAPKIFCIRNKSLVRHLLFVYVQGWSYDLLSGEAVETGDSATRELCLHCLSPLRSSRCWARVSATTLNEVVQYNPYSSLGCVEGSGVSCAPLVVPSIPFAFEKEVFWSATPNTNQHCTDQKVGDESEKESKGKSKLAGGVGSRFKKAKEIHLSSLPGSPVSTEAADKLVTDKENKKPSPASPLIDSAEGSSATPWDDRNVLLQHALNIRKDVDALYSLGFTCCAPPPHGETTAARDSAEVPWREFPSASKTSTRPRVVALDCEMVLVDGYQSVLARATLLDARTGDILLDRLVKPELPVTNYLTRYSGITEEMLRDVTYRLEDCQKDLCEYIDADTFLVGHSLENDLKACRFLPNCYILDSAWLYPHPAGLPCKNSLRFLVNYYFNMKIQQGSHDSTEDAWCSAQLVRLKLENGPEFGVPIRKSILCRIGAAGSGGRHHHISLFDYPHAMSELAPVGSSTAGAGAINTVTVRHDDDAVRKAVNAIRESSKHTQEDADDHSPSSAAPESPFHLFWVRLCENPNPLKNSTDDCHAKDVGSGTGCTLNNADAAAEQNQPFSLAEIDKVNQRILRLVEACPNDTIVLVAAGGEPEGRRRDTDFLPAGSGFKGTLFAFVKDGSAPGPHAAPDVGDTALREGRPSRVSLNPPACNPQ